MLLEETLALAVKNYRTIVDSRRFISLATDEEFKYAFDTILGGLLENLSECFDAREKKGEDESETFIIINQKKTLMATEILKILIILKHFINDPVYSDEIGHEIFEKVAKSLKIIGDPSEGDEIKAKRRFESFIVTLYVLFCEDESLDQNAKLFFNNMAPGRFELLLLEAAPRASQEEIYHKSYRKMLLRIGTFFGDATFIIKRLDSYYPTSPMIEEMSRKEFLLKKIGWKSDTIYHCADKIIKQVNGSFENDEIEGAIKGFEKLWIIIADSKFVAVDQCCATLFIFPSESESFLKIVSSLQTLFSKLKIFLNQGNGNLSPVLLQKIVNINSELYKWVEKLVRALAFNYTHFEQDLNNQTSSRTNKILYKIILVLVNLSKDIHETIKVPQTYSPIGELKLVSEYIEKEKRLSNDDVAVVVSNETSSCSLVNNNTVENENSHSQDKDKSIIELVNISLDDKLQENTSQKPDQINKPKDHISIVIPQSTASVEELTDSRVPIWAAALAVLSLLVGIFSIKSLFYPSNKS